MKMEEEVPMSVVVQDSVVGELSTPRKQKGITLIETMIVLMIVVAIMALGAGMFGSAIGRSDATQAISNITNIITSARTLRTGTGYPDDADAFNDAMLRIEGYPSNMEVNPSGNGAINLWGGEIVVSPTTSGGGSRAFQVSSELVPESVCHELVTKVGQSRFMTTTVGGSDYDYDELEDAAAQCSGDENEIVWTVTG
ncbi:type 4 pilus major pilin [Halomonas elongata]|uniref:type 4 pilus major pilin n=1 Tax=Halomonas elongata TaxID=2746 RepID=UPI00255B114D|nr:type 4 pilus major pilin [Halomonas elongata]MDL4860760.1 type 4 pilus major pilin [Halomonas elongata]